MYIYIYILINPCNAYNINQDSGAWVLIFEGFWVLKWVFEWCRIDIKTVLAQHYSLVVFYPILLWFTYAWFIQANPVQVGPGPPKSAQVNPNSQVLPGSPRFSQVLPGSPRKLVISCDFVGFRDFLGEPGCYFLRFCGVSGIEPGCYILWGFRDFLGEPGCYFLRFCGVSGISWDGWKQLGMGLGELQELVRGKVAGGWPAILTCNF